MLFRSLKKINRNQVLPAGIVLTGSGSSLFSMEEMARVSLRLPAKAGSLMPHNNHSLNISSASNNLKDQILNDPGWSVALGLCLASANGGSLIHGEGNSPEKSNNLVKSLKKMLHSMLP